MDSIETQNKRLFDASYVTVYLSGQSSKMRYPYILGNAKRPSPTMASISDIYIMDSAIGKDDITNEDVAYETERLDADAAVPKDFIGSPERALESARELYEMVDVPIIVPIHSGDEGHEYWARNAYDIFGSDVWAYGVGGVKDAGSNIQIDAVKQVRNVVGVSEDVHLFGGGMSKRWIREIRNSPDLLDSLDMSTPERAPIHGNMVLPSMTHKDVGNLRGKHSTIRRARITELSTINFCYMISDLIREEDVEDALNSPD